MFIDLPLMLAGSHMSLSEIPGVHDLYPEPPPAYPTLFRLLSIYALANIYMCYSG
jgi:hypothetical protein